MLRRYSLLIAVGISLIVVGYNSSKQAPKASNVPYSRIELGMPLDDAKAFVDGEGDKRAYDKLPVVPKPRDIYSKLPAETEWHVWTTKGKPTLILGVVGGKIAFKQVVWTQDGEHKGDANALPAYQ
jgi:hypothetical protein